MLKTIRQKICSLPDIGFNEFYTMYIMSVQDINIKMELDFLVRRNQLAPDNMDILIKNTYERLKLI